MSERLTKAEKAMLERLKKDPYYRPTRGGAVGRFERLRRKGLIYIREGKALIKNPARFLSGGRIFAFCEQENPELVAFDYCNGDPAQAILALQRGNPRALRVVASAHGTRDDFRALLERMNIDRTKNPWVERSRPDVQAFLQGATQ